MSATDLELLRRYEPVVRYTQGELFLPMGADEYLAHAALHRTRRDRKGEEVLAEAGTITPDRLAELGREHDQDSLYLQYVEKPLSRKDFRSWRQDPDRPRFTASSRFASVGLLSRLIDTTMRLTLLLRGRVPGGYAAAAHQQVGKQAAYVYHGHVLRDAGYVVLQYWYLYAMNDWRSTFGGVNDHEADWEQVTLFLVDHGPDADPEPAWVAFSSHDEVGDDLRRRWDDPDITFVGGTHPVVYAGAGSHSGAYLPGEYVIGVGLPIPGPIDRLRRAVMRVLPWGDGEDAAIGIPYIDYRRGDGVAIGPMQERSWSPVLVTDDTHWVRDFRGLWGLDTRDPLGGERAPAGPRYDRDGSVRESWRQPVAWAGLDKEAPTDTSALDDLRSLRHHLEAERLELEPRLEEAREQLRGARFADRLDGRDPRHASRGVVELDTQLATLRARDADLAERLEAVDRAASRTAKQEPVHAHLRHRATPLEHADKEGLRQRLLRIWAAASASLLLGAAGILMLFGDVNLVRALLLLVLVSIAIEAALRGRFVQLLVNLGVALLLLIAVAAVIDVVVGNFRQGVGVLLLLAAAYMGWQTLRDGART